MNFISYMSGVKMKDQHLKYKHNDLGVFSFYEKRSVHEIQHGTYTTHI